MPQFLKAYKDRPFQAPKLWITGNARGMHTAHHTFHFLQSSPEYYHSLLCKMVLEDYFLLEQEKRRKHFLSDIPLPIQASSELPNTKEGLETPAFKGSPQASQTPLSPLRGWPGFHTSASVAPTQQTPLPR